MKLISHSAYEELIDLPTISDAEFRIKSRNYRSFLKKPLKLELFVPCDDDGNVLEEPDSIGVGNDFYLERAINQYNEAQEKVIFEGFEYKKELRNSGGNYTHFVSNNETEIYIQFGGFSAFGKFKISTIEDIVKYNLELKPSAIKL